VQIKAIITGVAKILLLGVIALLVTYWVAVSRKTVLISLGPGRDCKWQLNHWCTGRCLFSYYEHGVCKGTVRTCKGLFEWPGAVFAGLDGESVICIYELDTTVAVFTIDLTKRNSAGISPPKSLTDTVLFSNFAVRACTKAEVAYVKRYISVNSDVLFKRTFALNDSNVAPERLKKNLLNALALGTTPNEEREVSWRQYSQPQILPEN